MLQPISDPRSEQDDQFTKIKLATIENLLDPLEKDWLNIVIEAKMAAAKDPDPGKIGEILRRRFHQLIEDTKETQDKRTRDEIAKVCKENDELNEAITKIARQSNNMESTVASQNRVIAELHDQIQILTSESKTA